MFGSEKEDINESLPVTTQQDDSTAIESTDNTIISDNTSTTTDDTAITTPVSTKSSGRRQNITDDERAAAKDKTPTYGGATGDNANPNGGKQNADNAISPEMVGQDGEESAGYKEEAAKADKEEDIKAEQNTDPSFTIDADNTKEEESEAGNINGSTDAGESTSWGDIYKGTVQK